MLVAAHTYTFRDRPLAEALDAICDLGIEFVELWHGHATTGGRAAARALERRDLRAVAVGAGGFYTADPMPVDAVLAIARAVEAPIVVACLAPQHAASIAARLPPGRVLAVENHWDQAIARPRDVARLLNAFPTLSACLDTGHALLAGVRPERFAEVVGWRVRHVHLKDARPPSLGELALGRKVRKRLLPRPDAVFPGDGGLDFPRILDAVRRSSPAATISLEYEGEEPEAALAALLDRTQLFAVSG